MPLPSHAPAWALELALSFESGAHSQFILHGNIHDRQVAEDGRLGTLADWLAQTLLAPFAVVFSYDLGEGLRVLRGLEQVSEFTPAKGALPREPGAACALINGYLTYLDNLRLLGRRQPPQVAVIVRGAEHLCPSGQQWGHELAALTAQVRAWAGEAPFVHLPFASFLLVGALADLNPLIARNPLAARCEVPMPSADQLARAIGLLRRTHAKAFAELGDDAALAQQLVGASCAAVESMAKRAAHRQEPIRAADLVGMKKRLVEGEAGQLIEFITSSRTLADYHGQPALKQWLEQDSRLWQQGDLQAMPMGYLICGPVGTGKTFLVECLAGAAGVPVVKLKNFRDKWVGSSEGNLETIFRLIHALGRCMVFVDEADQSLGKRDSGGSDGGVSGRLYSMLAQQMSDTSQRGKVLWILASSRPDLIEIDLKRPGRIDVKVPLLPTATQDESLGLLRALAKRRSLTIDDAAAAQLHAAVPVGLTPGAAEALAVKAYRLHRTQGLDAAGSLRAALDGWQPPVPQDIMQFQTRIAVRESSDIAFVPPAFRHHLDA